MRLLFLFLLLCACGKNSNDDVIRSANFYGSAENATEITVSKFTFIEHQATLGSYQVSQAVIRKSDNVVLKSNTFCGDFEDVGSLAVFDTGYGPKHYNTVSGFYESPYLQDGIPTVPHTKSAQNSAFIDTALASLASCL